MLSSILSHRELNTRIIFIKRHERINLAVPKGMKEIIKRLDDKDMSVNSYIQDLVRKDQCGLLDTMQIAEKNREMISGISGNMHDGYDIVFKDGHSCHCRTKKMSASVSLNTVAMTMIDSSFLFPKSVLHKISKVLHKTSFLVSYLFVTC